MTRQLQKHDVLKSLTAAAVLLFTAAFAYAGPEGEDKLYAMVPNVVIYPGQTISSGQIRRVEVTNPNLSGDYAQDFSQVDGMVSKRTLLPDQAIYISALRQPFAVSRGTQVRMLYDGGHLQITAIGIPLDDGSVGESVRVRNKDSGLTVSGVVLSPGIVQVVAK